MILLALEAVALFVGLTWFFAFRSRGLHAFGLAIIVVLVVGWGLLTFQMSRQWQGMMCADRAEPCVIDLGALAEDPDEHREAIRLNRLLSHNALWGWAIWPVFVGVAFGVSFVVRRRPAKAT